MAGSNQQTDWQTLQETNNAMQNVQAQRQQNLSNARIQNMANVAQTDTLAQASGVMVEAMRPAQLNPTTQGILGKYGVTRPQTVRSQSTQQIGGNTTIINNNTTTYNTVSSDYGGPVQGRALAFKQQEAGLSKFKLWLDNLFAKQKSENALRDREYARRERDLQKEQNKLSRKLEGLGASIGKALDPRRQAGQTNQLKQLLTMFGIGTLALNFDKVLDKLENFKSALEYFGLHDGKFTIKGSKFEEETVEKLGGSSGESIGTALKELLIGDDGLWGRIHDSFDIALRERAEAIGNIKKPGKNWNISEAVGYIGDVLAAALGGSKFAKRSTTADILGVSGKDGLDNFDRYGRTTDRNTKNLNGLSATYKDKNGNRIKNTSVGDLSVLQDNVVGSSYLDKNGSLHNNTGTSYVQSKEIGTLMNETNSTQVHTTRVMSGFQRLKQSAKSNGATLVDDNFFESLSSLGVGNDSDEVKKNLGISEDDKITYKFVSSEKTNAEWMADQAKWANARKYSAGVGALLGGVGAIAVAAGTAGIGIGGAAALEGLGAATGAGAEKLIEDAAREGRIVRMVPAEMDVGDGDIEICDKNKNLVTVSGYAITPETIDKIEKSISKDFSFDVSDKNSREKFEQLLIDIKKKNIAKQRQGEDYDQFISKLHSDTENDVFSESLGNFDIVAKYEQEKEDLRNRHDRLYKSIVMEGKRNFDELQKVLGEEASPELVDFIMKSGARLDAWALKESSGDCGGYVRDALAYAGADIPSSGMHAYKFNDWCSSHGYAQIGHWNKASKFNLNDIGTEAKPGDILVIGPARGHEAGHVAVLTQHGWRSDFEQNTPLGLNHPGEYGDVTMYRPTNDVLNFVNKRTLAEATKNLIKNGSYAAQKAFEPGGNSVKKTEEAAYSEEGTAEEVQGTATSIEGAGYTPSPTMTPNSRGLSDTYSIPFVPAWVKSSSSAAKPSYSAPETPAVSTKAKETAKKTAESNNAREQRAYNRKMEDLIGKVNELLASIEQTSKVTSLATTSTADSTGVIKNTLPAVASAAAQSTANNNNSSGGGHIMEQGPTPPPETQGTGWGGGYMWP